MRQGIGNKNIKMVYSPSKLYMSNVTSARAGGTGVVVGGRRLVQKMAV